MRISYLICATETFAKGMSCFDKSISIFLPRFGKVFLPKDSLLLIIMTKEKEERRVEREDEQFLFSPLLFSSLCYAAHLCSPLLSSSLFSFPIGIFRAFSLHHSINILFRVVSKHCRVVPHAAHY